jgi:thiamine monophosphate synthase
MTGPDTLYAITDDDLSPAGALVQYVTHALKGGASILHIAARPPIGLAPTRGTELAEIAGSVPHRQRRCRSASPFPRMAYTWADDMDLAAARRRLGNEFILGASC